MDEDSFNDEEEEEEDDFGDEDEDCIYSDEDEEWREDEILQYGYELDEDDDWYEVEDFMEAMEEGTGGLDSIEIREDMRENLGPEDGEAEDEYDGYIDYYAPL